MNPNAKDWDVKQPEFPHGSLDTPAPVTGMPKTYEEYQAGFVHQDVDRQEEYRKYQQEYMMASAERGRFDAQVYNEFKELSKEKGGNFAIQELLRRYPAERIFVTITSLPPAQNFNATTHDTYSIGTETQTLADNILSLHRVSYLDSANTARDSKYTAGNSGGTYAQTIATEILGENSGDKFYASWYPSQDSVKNHLTRKVYGSDLPIDEFNRLRDSINVPNNVNPDGEVSYTTLNLEHITNPDHENRGRIDLGGNA